MYEYATPSLTLTLSRTILITIFIIIRGRGDRNHFSLPPLPRTVMFNTSRGGAGEGWGEGKEKR